ncbi:MAG TPA: chemotaxis-specific protein-glutamate methyltransferase CheB [Longimicrobiales bacterium]|nr:chemotaxis-specific protein-glutamate methyltransferase CheB [Longimicrobiales bacterium]
MSRVRLAIVDDAAFIRSALVRLLHGTPVEVVGVAKDGEELMRHIDEWQPDVITLDLQMPGMGGMSTLDRVMATRPTPVIIMSAHSGEGAPLTVEALSRGAADFIDKEAYSLIDFERLRQVIVEKAVALAGAGVTAQPERPAQEPAAAPAPAAPPPRPGGQTFDLVVIGASTGGPSAIERILHTVGTARVPIAIAQHMSAEITRAFAERLDRTLGMRVREGDHGEEMEAGVAYIAPGGADMRVEGTVAAPRLAICEPAPGALNRPSVDVLFESAARVSKARTLAVLLTGMGRDGARGMGTLRAAGAHTIAQDAESCVVHGMPRAAVEAGAAVEVLSLDAIGLRLRALVGQGD